MKTKVRPQAEHADFIAGCHGQRSVSATSGQIGLSNPMSLSRMERILQTDSRESQQTQRLSLNLRSSSKPLGVPAAPFGAHAGTSASVWQSPLYIARCGDVHFDAANMPFPGLGCISRSVAGFISALLQHYRMLSVHLAATLLGSLQLPRRDWQ